MSASQRTLLRLGAGAAFVLVALCSVAVPASAHTELIGTSPAPQSNAQAPPESVVLTFSGSVLPVGSIVRVTDSSGATLSVGPPTAGDRRVVQRLAGDVAAGPVTVVWRVVAEDGHQIQGTFTFSVAGSGAAADPSGTAAPTRDQATSSDAEAAGSPGWLLPALAFTACVGLATVAFLAVRRRRP